jgi:hypothetical protein
MRLAHRLGPAHWSRSILLFDHSCRATVCAQGGLLSDSLLHIVPDIGFQLTGSLPFGPQDPHIVNENVQPLAESRYDPGTRRLPVDFELEPDIPGPSSDDPGLTDNRYACVVTPGPTYAQLGQQLEALVLVCRSICHFFRCQPP